MEESGSMLAKALKLTKGAEPYPGYKLGGLLGNGGWGEVWKAESPTGKSCALKFLPCDHDASAAVEVRALQAIRRLKHANLVGIDQVWSCSGYLVLVMELADGSLQDILDIYHSEYRQPLPREHVCFFLTQAAAAIDFLNARQHLVNGQRVAFRHCDVKPSNLLFFGKTIKLADFSLAVQTTARMGPHRPVGTLAYCPPELLQGWLSERSDQFSLAVTYFHLRCGQMPFPHLPTKVGRDFVHPPPDLSKLTPGERIILARALSPVPQDRWPACSDMMRRLTELGG